MKNQVTIEKAQSAIKTKKEKELSVKFKLILFLIENNLPFSMIEPLLNLFSSLNKTHELKICPSLKFHRNYASLIYKDGISQYLRQELIQRMKNFPFSLGMDEAKDSAGKKYLLIMTRFLNRETFLYESYLHSLIHLVESSTGENLNSILKEKVLTDFQIKKKFLGLASDGAANFRGNGADSLISKLSNELPYLWHIHDVSHCLNLVSKHSIATLPTEVFQFVHNVTSAFSRSDYLREKLKKVKETSSKKELHIFRFSETRWGSARECLGRILERWNELRVLFGENSEAVCQNEEDNSALESEDSIWKDCFTLFHDSAVKSNKEIKINNDLQKVFDETNSIKQYLQMTYQILDILMKMNIEFQSEQISIKDFRRKMKGLILEFTDYILIEKNYGSYQLEELYQIFKPEKIRNKNREWYDPLYHKTWQNFVSYLKLRDNSIDYEKILNLEEWCLNIMRLIHECVIRLLHYIPLQDIVLVTLDKCLRLTEVKIDDWLFLAQRFPNIIEKEKLPLFIKEVDKIKREEELINEIKSSNKNNLMDIWKDIFHQKTYPLLSNLALALLSLPVSTVFVERCFKTMKTIKNTKRNKLLPESLEAVLLSNYNMNNSLEDFKDLDKMIELFQDNIKKTLPQKKKEGLSNNDEDSYNREQKLEKNEQIMIENILDHSEGPYTE